jgi:hypothetical protein
MGAPDGGRTVTAGDHPAREVLSLSQEVLSLSLEDR